jgi:dolichyl-phosphate-mannose-protein mannosyltransferase
MGRQLFLHHYLPAHLASALVTGALLEFIFIVDAVEDEPAASSAAALSQRKKNSRVYNPNTGSTQRTGATSGYKAMWAGSAVVLAIVIAGWWYFLPLTYGRPGLTVDQVNARKWLSYDLHFAK